MQSDSKFCYNCGTPVTSDARFCKYCGIALAPEQPITLRALTAQKNASLALKIVSAALVSYYLLMLLPLTRTAGLLFAFASLLILAIVMLAESVYFALFLLKKPNIPSVITAYFDSLLIFASTPKDKHALDSWLYLFVAGYFVTISFLFADLPNQLSQGTTWAGFALLADSLFFLLLLACGLLAYKVIAETGTVGSPLLSRVPAPYTSIVYLLAGLVSLGLLLWGYGVFYGLLIICVLLVTLGLWFIIGDKMASFYAWQKKHQIVPPKTGSDPVATKPVWRNTLYTGLFFFGLGSLVWKLAQPYWALDAWSSFTYIMIWLFPISALVLPADWILNQLHIVYKDRDEVKRLGIPNVLKGLIGASAILAVLFFLMDFSMLTSLGFYSPLSFVVNLAMRVLPLAYLSSALYTGFLLRKHTSRVQRYIKGHKYRKREVFGAVTCFGAVTIVFVALSLPFLFTPVGQPLSYSYPDYGFSFQSASFLGEQWNLLTQRDLQNLTSKALLGATPPEFQVGLEQSSQSSYRTPRLIIVSVSNTSTQNISAAYLQTKIAQEDYYVSRDPTLLKVSSNTVLVNGAPGYEYRYTSNMQYLLSNSSAIKAVSEHAYTICVLYGNQREYRIAADSDLINFANFDEKFFQPVIVQNFHIFQTNNSYTTNLIAPERFLA